MCDKASQFNTHVAIYMHMNDHQAALHVVQGNMVIDQHQDSLSFTCSVLDPSWHDSTCSYHGGAMRLEMRGSCSGCAQVVEQH